MTAPDRIWIDAWGGKWSPRSGGTQELEYVRRDPAVLAALPEVVALVADAVAKMQRSRDRYREAWEAEKAHCTAIRAKGGEA